MECLRLFAAYAVSSFGTANAFLHSPPMVESSARSYSDRAIFLPLPCIALHHRLPRSTDRRRARFDA